MVHTLCVFYLLNLYATLLKQCVSLNENSFTLDLLHRRPWSKQNIHSYSSQRQKQFYYEESD